MFDFTEQTAIVTGGTLGTFAGYFWQTADASRRARSSGRHLALTVIGGVGVLWPMAVFLLGPILYSEEMVLARIRTLSVTDVAAISVQMSGQPPVKVTDPAAIVSFVESCRSSKLFYPSQERFTNESQLTVDFVDGTVWTYQARIPEKHQADLALTFRSHVGYSHILIPNGAKWLLKCRTE